MSKIVVSFPRAKTLQDISVRSKLPRGESEGSCQGCNRSNCQVCKFVKNSESFTNSDSSITFTIRRENFNCNSNCVVYRLLCNTCDKQYIGSTKTAFRLRFKSH